MADKIASQLGADIKRYNICNVKFDDTIEKYSVRYALMVKGYKTTEYVSVAFDKNLNFLIIIDIQMCLTVLMFQI